MKYTKHYYVGSERVSAKSGTLKELGLFPDKVVSGYLPDLNVQEIRGLSNDHVNNNSGSYTNEAYQAFGMNANLETPIEEGDLTFTRHTLDLTINYFHSDHLGSSNFISDAGGYVTQHMEYTAFGELLAEEHLNSNNSPFKFNGKELDEETGNYYYGARYYNPKWSIWLSVDPFFAKYPTLSPFVYVANNPLKYIDPDGRRIILYSKKGEPYEYKDGNLINPSTGKVYQGNDSFLLKNKEALTKLDYASTSFYLKDGHIKKRGIIQDIVNSDDIYSIVHKDNVAQAIGSRIEIDPFSNASTPTVRTTKGKQRMPYEITLAHELGHVYSTFKGFSNGNTWFSMLDSSGKERDVSFDENWAMHFENYFRSEMNLPLRTHYNELNKSAIFSPIRLDQKPISTLKTKEPEPVFRSPRHF